MHKRTYIKTPQDVRPWHHAAQKKLDKSSGVVIRDLKLLVRWRVNKRRGVAVRILSKWIKAEKKKIMLRAFRNNQEFYQTASIQDKGQQIMRESVSDSFCVEAKRPFRRTTLPLYRKNKLGKFLKRRNLLLMWKQNSFSKWATHSKLKNICLFMGNGSTFSRKLFMSRTVAARLLKCGYIQGIKS